jgi:thiol:disulfide interchange protein DsbD
VAAAGVILGALQRSFHGGTRERVLKGLGVALLVGAAVYASGAAAARDRARAAGFAWLHSEPEALALAKAEGRPVVIDFWAEWCTACKELDKKTWPEPAVAREAARFVALKVDGTEGDDVSTALAKKYGVVGMPTVVFIDGQGRQVPQAVIGFIDAREMLQALRAVDQACAA